MKNETIQGSLLHKAHQLIRDEIKDGETAVDATVGNGHDTLFLANCVGENGEVIGFDIQKDAIDATRARLVGATIDKARFELHQCSHSELENFVADRVAVIMFNLGYLPSGDKAIITKLESTMLALKSALMRLRKNGILSVMCYPGHSGGDTEAAAVKQWFTEIDIEHYEVVIYRREGAKETTPFLMTAQRKM